MINSLFGGFATLPTAPSVRISGIFDAHSHPALQRRGMFRPPSKMAKTADPLLSELSEEGKKRQYHKTAPTPRLRARFKLSTTPARDYFFVQRHHKNLDAFAFQD